jgi:signal peptidase I
VVEQPGSYRAAPPPAPGSYRAAGDPTGNGREVGERIDPGWRPAGWDLDDRQVAGEVLTDDLSVAGRRGAWPGAEGEPGADLEPDPGQVDYDYLLGEDDEYLDQTSAVTRNALEWAVVLVGAVLVALVLRASVFQAFYIPSESMESTLLINDRVLVNKVSYHLHDINRGDVVVFERPENEPGEIRDLIKRVIGLPGETIEIRDDTVYINGNRLVEPYLDEGTVMEDHGPVVVPEGHLFVMGDNRDESQDSRFFGPIDSELVVGRAFVLFWPFNRAGSL